MAQVIVPNTNSAARDAASLLGPLSRRRPHLRRDSTGRVQRDQYVLNVTEGEAGPFKRLMREAGHDVGILLR